MHYGVLLDESRPLGSHNPAGMLEIPPGEKRPKVNIRTASGSP